MKLKAMTVNNYSNTGENYAENDIFFESPLPSRIEVKEGIMTDMLCIKHFRLHK